MNRQPCNRNATSGDPDLLAFAKPGYGVPSQDPDPAAQFSMGVVQAGEEAKAAFLGAGVMGGVAMGALIGSLAAGPVGTIVGGTLGSIVGALSGASFGTTHQDRHRRFPVR